MRIFGCCRVRRNEATAKEVERSSVENVSPSPVCGQRVCKAVKLALNATAVGAITGGVLGAVSSRYLCLGGGLCADDIFDQIQAYINNGTTSYHENDWIRAVFSDRVIVSTMARGIEEAVIGGGIGAFLGVMRICRELLCQKTMKQD